jgi:hypothetical protein
MFNFFETLFLQVIFFFILTPVALLMRLFKYDPLKIKANQKKSFWLIRLPVKFDSKFFNKQG